MASKERASRLAALFSEAGRAHHQAFIKSNGEDPEWPIWYAEYLQPKVSDLLETFFTRSELVYLLIKVEKERQENKAKPTWSEYYATFFLQPAQRIAFL